MKTDKKTSHTSTIKESIEKPPMIPFLKKISQRSLSLLLATMIALPFISVAQEDNEEQWFQLGKQAIITKSWDQYFEYRDKLADSTLLPYLEFYYYQERIEESDPLEVLNFAEKYAKEPFANTIKLVLFKERARQKNYQFIVDNAQYATTLGLRCYLYTAQLQQSSLNLEDFQKEWVTQLQLPSGCAPAEAFWLKSNPNTSLVKKKVDDLVEAGRLAKAKTLIQSLPEENQTYYNYFIRLLENPPALLEVKTFYPEGKNLYAKVLQKWSGQNSLAAEKGLQLAKRKNLLTKSDYIKLRNRIAVFQAGRSDVVSPLDKILAIPGEERNDQLLQWGFRLAIQQGNYPIALALLSSLSVEAQKEDVWRYWLGRTYAEVGDPEQARSYYELIENSPTFYGFLASDELRHNYDGITAIAKEKSVTPSTTINARFSMGLLLAKVNEEYFSRVKWQEALRNSTKAEQEAGSIAAFEAGFYNLSLQAAARARAQGGLSYRYPSAYTDIIEQYSNDLITEPVVLGLIRQESLFNEKAKSQASAYGLMQLLIPTAERMSSDLNETERASLYDPEANIRYGITYLKNLEKNVGSCIPFMLASYNAGPHNVKKWLPENASGKVDMALWIETIPFYETRGYVKNVLSNAIIYHTLNDQPKRLSDYLHCEM